MTATKLMLRMNVPPRVLGKCNFESKAIAAALPAPAMKWGWTRKEKQNARASRDISRKNTRLDCACCCTCVAVEGGQMHEDAGVAGSMAHAPLEGLKRKRPVALSAAHAVPRSDMKRRNDRRAFLYKNCSIPARTRVARQIEKNVNEGELLLERGT
ncbi:hypothetical protein [Paraburkholderia metrosideri]|uniref:hypothetical protein n=1 Tax=Paraburkholderia metrosideri TaxID=580937 RepID=UPI00191815A6|nr:hypothetical protein [Paraburkholderia metrosideri]